MPNLNGTGPEGQGSMTGKAMGYCAENSKGASADVSANSNFGLGLGLGLGRGRGLGCGRGRAVGAAGRGQAGLGKRFRWQQVEITPDEEKNFLKNQLKSLEAESENIKKRLGEFEA